VLHSELMGAAVASIEEDVASITADSRPSPARSNARGCFSSRKGMNRKAPPLPRHVLIDGPSDESDEPVEGPKPALRYGPGVRKSRQKRVRWRSKRSLVIRHSLQEGPEWVEARQSVGLAVDANKDGVARWHKQDSLSPISPGSPDSALDSEDDDVAQDGARSPAAASMIQWSSGSPDTGSPNVRQRALARRGRLGASRAGGGGVATAPAADTGSPGLGPADPQAAEAEEEGGARPSAAELPPVELFCEPRGEGLGPADPQAAEEEEEGGARPSAAELPLVELFCEPRGQGPAGRRAEEEKEEGEQQSSAEPPPAEKLCELEIRGQVASSTTEEVETMPCPSQASMERPADVGVDAC